MPARECEHGKEREDQKGKWDPKDHKEKEDQTGHWDSKDHKDHKEKEDQKGIGELEDQKGQVIPRTTRNIKRHNSQKSSY